MGIALAAAAYRESEQIANITLMPPTVRSPRQKVAASQSSLAILDAASSRETARSAPEAHHVVGLFAGIGGIERGLKGAGHRALLLCEKEPAALAVLKNRFEGVDLHPDVTRLDSLPSETTLLTAGFPCQDLSQAGRTAGIHGANSGLVSHVFRLLRQRIRDGNAVPWLLLENVSFMLRLSGGSAFRHVIEALESLDYIWAYRVVDSRSFGVPQRRQRVYLLACRREAGDPRAVLFADDVGQPEPVDSHQGRACGFYWTEGIRGLGWAVDAVPTLKGGSTIGIASPPAIWMPAAPPGRRIVTPEIRDAELLQGFPPDWTDAAGRPGVRWKLVGNAVTVNAAEWIGKRMAEPGVYQPSWDRLLSRDESWPEAAWCTELGERYAAAVSMWPQRAALAPLEKFLQFESKPLSARATAGFLKRTRVSRLKFPAGFLEAIESHLHAVSRETVPT